MIKKFGMLLLVLSLVIPFSAVTLTIANTGTSLFTSSVERYELVSSLEETVETNGVSGVNPFWVDMVDAEWVENDGEGVYIAVLDTGLLSIWPFFFLDANIAWELGNGFTHDVYWDGTDIVFGPLYERSWITDPEGSGHGTHVVSTIVGYNYNNLFWVQGVAPEATIIPVLVLEEWEVPTPSGDVLISGGTDEMVSAGIYYAANLVDELDGPLIINMSLGGPDPSPMIEEAINYAIDQGVIVVVSAGNSGYDGMGWPGAYPQVISCAMGGWTEQWVGYPDRWWLYDVPEKLNKKDYWGNNWQLFLDYLSSRPNKDLGQKSQHLDLTTPGCAIVGPYKPRWSTAIGYYYLWGTSMAAPHTSAIAALVLESYPMINQGTMEFILKKAASGLPLPADGSLALDVPGYLYYFTWYGTDYGAGFLQAPAALKFAKNHH